MLIFVNIIGVLNVSSSPVDVLLQKNDFGSDYNVGSVIGQPVTGDYKWGYINGASWPATVVQPVAPAPLDPQSGKLLKLDPGSLNSGQVTTKIQSQTSKISIKSRVYITTPAQESIIFLIYGNSGTSHAQFLFNKGKFQYNGSGGSTVSSDFSPSKTYGAGWHEFELIFSKPTGSTYYENIEYYYNGAKLGTSGTAYTYRNKVSNIDQIGFQINTGNNTGYATYVDYISITQIGVLFPLPKASTPIWNGQTLNWDAVTGAASYSIVLRKDGVKVATVPATGEQPITGTAYDLAQLMDQYGFGKYQATIQAIADPTQDGDGYASDPSDFYNYVNNLPFLNKPTPPNWTANIINWETVAGATAYTVELYKGAVKVNTASVNETSYDFSSIIAEKGKGIYKVRVKAIANPRINRDGPLSELSPGNEYDPSNPAVTPTIDTYCIIAANAISTSTLTNESNNQITQNITLPISGLYDTKIVWSSNYSSVISNTGVVNRPIRGKDILVTLTALTTKDSRQYTKMFKFIVKSLDPEYIGDIEPDNIAYKNYSSQNKENTNVFSDVTSTHWAKNYIEYLYNEGIIKGTNDGKFEPDRNITREEVCSILINALGITNNDKDVEFSDVNVNMWFYKSVAMSYSAGIVNGISETEFGTGTNISRQDLVTMIVRATTVAEFEHELINEKTTFADEADIADYAKDSIRKLQMTGILSGNSDGNVNPLGTATRAEVAKLICLIHMLVNQNK
jgi:hypothetical protein